MVMVFYYDWRFSPVPNTGIYRQKSQNQTDKQVIEHIKNINDKTPLTDEEWHKLIFPCCNNGYIVKC